MKRILLLGIVLAVCILAMPQGVLANTVNPPGVTVNAGYAGSALTFTPTTNGSATWPWALVESPVTPVTPTGNFRASGLNFTIDSTLDWTVAGDASTSHAGKMYSGTVNPLHSTLANPFLIKNQAGSMIDLTSSKDIANGAPAITFFQRDIDQKVVQEDYSANDYSIILTFTATNTWA